MHPTFVKLFLETGVDDLLAEEEDRRRAVNRGRRARSIGVARAGRKREGRAGRSRSRCHS